MDPTLMPGSPKDGYCERGRANPNKMRPGEKNSDEELSQLRRRLDALEERARLQDEESAAFSSVLATIGEKPMLAGHATREGTNRFAARFGGESVAFYRGAQNILMSSLGIGTNRGTMDDETDIQYARAVRAALQGGVNLIDTSLNYRHQRAERAVAAGIRVFIDASGSARDGIVVCTKGGYRVPGAMSAIGGEDGTQDRGHCMSPVFLGDQIERSRRNLRLETIDIYYLHNPEIQLTFMEMPVFMNCIRAAFEQLEHAVSSGFIRYYGTATWHGFRAGALSLRRLVAAARQVAGDSHHFRFVELPFNLGMTEALTDQVDAGATVLDVAAELGITVIASASLFRARLSKGLRMLLGQDSDVQRAIQFVRSTPGISSALVGMRDMMHVKENLAVSRTPPLTSSDYQQLFPQLSNHRQGF
jgi:aryl-alcohol dehydrogenase-like predicted oxidoreductase